MIIRCTSCHAEARIPTSKEGAKVRCGSCGHVYVARAPGARRSSNSTLPIVLGIGVVLALAVMFFLINRGGGEEPIVTEVQAEEPEEPAAVDLTGWDSKYVKLVREVYASVHAKDGVTIDTKFDPGAIWVHRQTIPEEPPQPGEDPPELPEITPWEDLDSRAQAAFLTDLKTELFEGDLDDVITYWEPFDGEVVSEQEDTVVVRVKVESIDGSSGEARTADWILERRGASRWVVAGYARWYSPEELNAMRRARKRLVKKVTLSDGSVVIEAQPKPLEHFKDTSDDLRAEIDSMYAQMIDLDLNPRDNAKAKQRLTEIGRPALPILLTGMYEIPLETEDQAIQVNLINQCLEDITGNYTGYKPQINDGSGTGTTNERRESAIKQWFGWWYRKGEKFTEHVGTDGLEEALQPKTEREKREYEKYRRQHEAAQKAGDGKP